MKFNERAAIKKYGTCDESRFMLRSGECLAVPWHEDHRIIGEFCQDSEFRFAVLEGLITLHYSDDGTLWIRRPEDTLSIGQRQAFANLLESFWHNRLRELNVHIIYPDDGRKGWRAETFIIKDSQLARLYLTDPIAYECTLSDHDREETEDSYYEEVTDGSDDAG